MLILRPIKPDLLKMCNNKCAFCESGIVAVSGGDIENFRPKGGARGLNTDEYAPMHYWWLVYEWENLLIACELCNRKYKRDLFPLEKEKNRCQLGATGAELDKEGALLIDPTVQDPAEHLEFNRNGSVIGLSVQGKATIDILGLNREELVMRRAKTAGELDEQLEMINSTEGFVNAVTEPFLKRVNDLLSDSPTYEYVALQRRIFDEWYEKNTKLWEDIKRSYQDRSETKRSVKKKTKQTRAQVKKAAKITEQLSAIKRFSIKSIDIENFKSIKKLTLNIPPPKEGEDRESWLLLLGDNGVGKSSILQAVAMALSTKKQLAKLKLDVLSYLRRGTDKDPVENGHVIIHSYEHDNPITLTFDKDGFKTDLVEAPTFVLAYGSTRLLPKGNIKPDKAKEAYFNIRNLFDYTVSLNDPNAWLCGLDDEEFRKRVAPAFFDVLALRGKDKLWTDDGRIRIHQFGQNNDLESASDGYKTITALVSDIMQTLSIEAANYHNSNGIVLIDEIGNHLHPRWRIKIAGALRKAFPKLQFVVTTHEPLCLRGLAKGEVIVLLRDKKNVVRALGEDLLPDHTLLRTDQLLTSDLFGLINVMDEEVDKKYEDYYALLSKPEEKRTAKDTAQIKQYAAYILEKEAIGSTPAEQVAFQVYSQKFADTKSSGKLTTIEELKKETLVEVKKLLDKKEIDWL